MVGLTKSFKESDEHINARFFFWIVQLFRSIIFIAGQNNVKLNGQTLTGGGLMKNVIIHKLEKYIFTEDQLKGAWKRLNKGKFFQELTNEQLMSLAKKILNDASQSELEEFTLGSGWRTKSDMTGKMIADDATDPTLHTEVIDTEQTHNQPNEIFIDRMLQLRCEDCHFVFYIDDLSKDSSKLSCPIDGGTVTPPSKRPLKSLNIKKK